ncbi:NrdH-redoxin [Candidatus Pacearchaeota archaeon CG_4_9_14_0_2_um_filter_39_13]|nr:glutaredoxin family protein [Candidatus Pacearchaeota archaeon]PJC44598.1 MAG: NrdH-redoxin [Candidatus Pacearchaeota archaeon CG_4_9_14_0_2_um_filter_39_13]
MKIIIYGTDSCPWCHKAREFMKEHKVKFTDKNVGEDQKAAQEMIKKSGQQGVPVIDVDGEIIVGFDEDRLKSLLNIKS